MTIDHQFLWVEFYLLFMVIQRQTLFPSCSFFYYYYFLLTILSQKLLVLKQLVTKKLSNNSQ